MNSLYREAHVKVNLCNENCSYIREEKRTFSTSPISVYIVYIYMYVQTLPICSIKNPSLRWRSNR
jgi:hypothetical protein